MPETETQTDRQSRSAAICIRFPRGNDQFEKVVSFFSDDLRISMAMFMDFFRWNLFHLMIWWLDVISGWWFGAFFIFPYFGNFIIPTEGLIFFRGVAIPPIRYVGHISIWSKWSSGDHYVGWWSPPWFSTGEIIFVVPDGRQTKSSLQKH